jgi:inosose dehydratase
LREDAEAAGVEVVAIHAGEVDGTSDRTVASTLTYTREVVAFAAAAGVPLVNVNGGPVASDWSKTDRAAAVRRIAHAVAELRPSADRGSVRLVFENHHQYQLDEPADYAELLAHLPASGTFGITADTGHLSASGVDVAQFLGAHSKRVLHVHLKDQRGTRSMPLGAGDVDLAAVFRALGDIGYRGYASVEIEAHEQGTSYREYLEDARGYLSRHLAGEPAGRVQ